ncbi:putative pickpocket [Operophtera brumata]|uniref:Putative pickpocket n=1 Tax=Operophtera brumata TaxID=104452 RepID=A0A0L7L5Y6_OPEBR|nr:putative pickpocket [Operophtera brumata]
MRRHSRSESVGRVSEGDLEQNEKFSNVRRESKYERRRNIVKEYLIDYTIFWLFMCICCVVLCAGLIRKVWIKWQESPVIVSFAENPTPVWQSKFNFTEYYHLYNNNDTYNNLTDDERHLFEDISMVCDDHLAPVNGRQFSSGLETVLNIKEVSPNLTDVFFGCKWKDGYGVKSGLTFLLKANEVDLDYLCKGPANCEMECLSNFTYTRCGCVHFGMPLELVTIAIQSGMNSDAGNYSDALDEAREVSSRCKCLPACTSIEYEAETSQADYDWRAIYRAYRLNITDEMSELSFARVMIFFKEAQFITSRRSELYGQTDFLANCGGLLGLFMGFSILSVAEILYFLTLRLCCVYWRKRNNKKKGKKIFAKEEIASPKLSKDKETYND